jgi:NTE family protein
VKIGVALGGGGAKGIAHLGALRVLEAAGASIAIVTGTSAGAIIGALYAAGKSVDEIERIARRWSLRQFLTLDRTGMGMFSTDGLRQIIESELGRDARIENLSRRFAAIAVDLDAQTEMIFESGSVADAVCASAAFPGFFAPVILGDRRFIDGGTLNPVPCDVARRLGADRVIAVDLNADEPVFTTAGERPLNREQIITAILSTAEKRKIVRVTARAIGIMGRAIREYRMTRARPDLVIYPNVQNVGLLDFDLTNDCLAAGEAATRAVLPQIQNLISDSRWRNAARKIKQTLRR